MKKMHKMFCITFIATILAEQQQQKMEKYAPTKTTAIECEITAPWLNGGRLGKFFFWVKWRLHSVSVLILLLMERGYVSFLILKAGESNNPTYKKKFISISLIWFLLKTLDKILDVHNRDTATLGSMSKAQYVYSKSRSVETAFHKLLFNIERALQNKECALRVLDIYGSFDNVATESILNST